MKNSLGKNERIKSRKVFDQLFLQGKSVRQDFITLKYFIIEEPIGEKGIQAGFAVPKKFFKLAVTRNKIKRRLKESYRVKKHPLETWAQEQQKGVYLLFMVYGKTTPTFREVDDKITLIISRLLKRLTEAEQNDLP